MTNASAGVVTQLAKQVRLVFSFKDIDFKRASKMDIEQPIGCFRIGYWDESNKNWVELPSQIFWDGTNGVAEAETDLGDGRYALLWSYRGDVQLSQIADQGTRVMIDNVPIKFTDAPYTKDDRTMVPLRAISNNLGAQVTWTASESRIDLVHKSDNIKLWVGKKEAFKSNQSLSIDVPPEVVNDRTFVPLRFIAEAFGAKVSWDDSTQTVKIFGGQ
ncbi:copper amine oxidase N-terminal domain-containing protein [Pelotomaculum isophthalicicum JI]|uniref:Copper amine oxidase N-terminal domain-containing protein n=1 Tax=Pelotomaculum isophthalicicum JI TaxID=947010 RepID=A0A9X4JTT4_9FIRM|nr:stalk domain-containing protein [Pelotomaculum isophthalicicum]MDF9407930.1 copper amine oxidase N-terminal domain-containing protein [Pelotomaculum isophthalicicum JI]